MNALEADVFARCVPDAARFEAAGLTADGSGGWRYSAGLLGGQFCADIAVSAAGEVSGRVVDAATGEEFLPLRTARAGAFTLGVRAAYRAVLEQLRAACFVRQPFASAQANRVAAYVQREFGAEPDFVFPTSPGSAVFRNAENQKWYAVVLSLTRGTFAEKILGRKPGEHGGPGTAEILNVKLLPAHIPPLLAQPGFFPAYHMNKAHWVTVALDGTVDDRRIFSLIAESRSFTVTERYRRAARAGRTGGRERKKAGRYDVRVWLLPAQPALQDPEPEFRRDGTAFWEQRADVQLGDTVYLYFGAPVSAVRYKCTVIACGIPARTPRTGTRTEMKLLLVRRYTDSAMTRERLESLGVTSVSRARHLPPAAVAALEH